MGMNAIKCGKYAGMKESASGEDFRSANDFNVGDNVKEALTIVAVGSSSVALPLPME